MDVTSIILAIVAALSLGVAFLSWRDRRRLQAGKHLDKRLDDKITRHLQPVEVRINAITAEVEHLNRTLPDTIQALVAREIQPLREDIRALNTKVEVFWRNVGLDLAKVLHQPDPARAHIDALLEAFMNGTLSSRERLELRKYLFQIRNWEPGQQLDFPVHPGEQTAAAILLRVMDHALEYERKNRSGNEKKE